ncbi:MAG: acyclic terpene utilization AtuA family protein, partial [Ilumatobacter sp.]|nr:acyclic terpene utilization AtuA family protein [Ilumatobacter sp.]
QEGPDRVRISGVKGDPAPAKLKVCINLEGGWRNRMSFVLSGLRQREKAAWLEDALFRRLGGKERFDEVNVRFVEAPSDAPTQEQASGRLHITVKSSDERVAGRAFSGAAIELALANYPGFFATGGPSEAQSYGVYWPALVDRSEVTETVVHPTGTREVVAPPPRESPVTAATTSPERTVETQADAVGPAAGEPLGAHFAARSGDKGGNANVGIYARDDAGYAWLAANLTAERVQQLLAEAHDLEVRRYELPNLRALNFVIVGILGDGVASSVAFDAQAKGLGEYLLSRVWPG